MSKLSILNIGGHPKDAILYTGGTMANHVANGDKVCTLTPTHGLSHHETAITDFKSNKPFDFRSLIEERKSELVAASAELGVEDVRFLGHDDTIILPKLEIIQEITDVILEVKPDIIITHWPNDTVPAHANATQMTLLAIEAASCVQKDVSTRPHSIKQIFFHFSQGRTNIRENSRPPNPTTIIDITDVVNLKTNAMNQFKSQYYGGDGALQRKLGEALDGDIHAIHARVPYAESFIADQPSLYSLLPLSDYELAVQNKTKEQTYKHLSQFLIQ
jgi:4-oxalomesaconate hydratase